MSGCFYTKRCKGNRYRKDVKKMSDLDEKRRIVVIGIL